MTHPRRFLRAVLAVVTTLVGLCATSAAWSADTYPKEIRIGVQKGDGLVALRMSGNLEKAFAPPT
jgi:sulfonate transport system substrate-binding protein